MKDPKLYLIFCDERIAKLEMVVGNDIDAAIKDETKWFAIERLLETLSDATKNIPEEMKAKHPDIPWKEIVGFRNRLAHDYLGIDAAVVKKIIQRDIPSLKKAIKALLGDIHV